MLHSDGSLGDVIESARVGLAMVDRRLADADQELLHEIGDAAALAMAVIAKIESVRNQIDEESQYCSLESAAQGREFARVLISHQREVSEIVRESRVAIALKTAALQRLSSMYQHP